MAESSQLVRKRWNYCNILRDGGLSYGDYVEQLAFLLFLKTADEPSRPPFNEWAQFQSSFEQEFKIKGRPVFVLPVKVSSARKDD